MDIARQVEISFLDLSQLSLSMQLGHVAFIIIIIYEMFLAPACSTLQPSEYLSQLEESLWLCLVVSGMAWFCFRCTSVPWSQPFPILFPYSFAASPGCVFCVLCCLSCSRTHLLVIATVYVYVYRHEDCVYFCIGTKIDRTCVV